MGDEFGFFSKIAMDQAKVFGRQGIRRGVKTEVRARDKKFGSQYLGVSMCLKTWACRILMRECIKCGEEDI